MSKDISHFSQLKVCKFQKCIFKLSEKKLWQQLSSQRKNLLKNHKLSVYVRLKKILVNLLFKEFFLKFLFLTQ